MADEKPKTDPAALLSALDDVESKATKAYGGDPRASDRVAQLSGAISTAKMAVAALDEESSRREHDRAERIRAAAAAE